MLSRSLAVLGAVIVLSLVNQPGWSQESKGAILGRITDSSGLVVPAATIQITNLATTVTTRSVSNGEGNYVAPFLVPGTYSITVEKTAPPLFESIIKCWTSVGFSGSARL